MLHDYLFFCGFKLRFEPQKPYGGLSCDSNGDCKLSSFPFTSGVSRTSAKPICTFTQGWSIASCNGPPISQLLLMNNLHLIVTMLSISIQENEPVQYPIFAIIKPAILMKCLSVSV